MQKRLLLTHILLLILLFGVQNVFSQTYPIQTNTVMMQPYPLHLSSFSSAINISDKVKMFVVLNDNNHLNYAVKIKLIIEGPGGQITTTSGEETPHNLNFGTNELPENIIKDLFTPNNLNTDGFKFESGSDEFPEGMYRFRIEVYDAQRMIPVSDPYSGTFIAWIARSQPPILMLPLDEVTIIPVENTQINQSFSWTPRGYIPSSADIEYTVEFVEMLAGTTEPAAAFNEAGARFTLSNLSSIAVNPTIPGDLNLAIDKWYAWRVVATDINNEIFFSNNGESEARKFYYGTPCSIPQNFSALAENEVITLSWDAEEGALYSMQVHKKGLWSLWDDVPEPVVTGLQMSGLDPGAEYEFQLRKNCTNNSSEYVEISVKNTGNIICLPPENFTARIDTSLFFGEKLIVEWEEVPGAINYQVDVRSNVRTLSKQVSAPTHSHSFRWSETGIYGDTIWVTLSSQCNAGEDYVKAEEKMLIMNRPVIGSGDCIAPPLVLTDTITYPTGITEVYWETNSRFSSYTFMWRPRGLAVDFQEINITNPPAYVEGLPLGTEAECKVIFHCNGGGSDESNLAYFTGRESIIDNSGSCWRPSYPRHYVPSLTSLQFMWQEEAGSPAYEVNWRKKTTPQSVWETAQTNETEYTVENLESGESYEYIIRTLCGGANGMSRWTEPITATLDEISNPSDNCPPPPYEQVNVSSAVSATLPLEATDPYTGFTAEYRIKGKFEWMEAFPRPESVLFTNLTADTLYEFKVRAFCGLGVSDFTPIDTFRTPKPLINTELDCSNLDITTLNGSTPVPLTANLPFSADGWDLIILEADENGNGKAYAEIPYLHNATVEFKLEEIQVNDAGEMFAGKAILTQVGVQLIDSELVDQINNLVGSLDGGIEQGELIIGQLQELVDLIPDFGNGNSSGPPSTSGLSAGDIYDLGVGNLNVAVDSLQSGGLSALGDAKVIAQNGIDLIVLAITTAGNNLINNEVGADLALCVTFLPHSEEDFGFDKYTFLGSELQYSAFNTADDQKYFIANKSISQGVATRKVIIELPTTTVSPDLHFYTQTPDDEITYTQLADVEEKARLEIEIPVGTTSVSAYDQIINEETTVLEKTLVGRLNTPSYDNKIINLVLVPINNISDITSGSIATLSSQISTQLNAIYSPAAIQWGIAVNEKLTVINMDNGVEDLDATLENGYSPSMNTIIDNFKAQQPTVEETFYIFVANKNTQNTKDAYMPLNSQFGFLFIENTQSEEKFVHNLAQSLGSGAFGLEKVYSNRILYTLEKGTTTNLMDDLPDSYSNTQMFNYQWDAIQGNQSGLFDLFDGGVLSVLNIKEFVIEVLNEIRDVKFTDYSTNLVIFNGLGEVIDTKTQEINDREAPVLANGGGTGEVVDHADFDIEEPEDVQELTEAEFATMRALNLQFNEFITALEDLERIEVLLKELKFFYTTAEKTLQPEFLNAIVEQIKKEILQESATVLQMMIEGQDEAQIKQYLRDYIIGVITEQYNNL